VRVCIRRIHIHWPLVVAAKTGGEDAMEAQADQFGHRLTAYQQYACNKFSSRQATEAPRRNSGFDSSFGGGWGSLGTLTPPLIVSTAFRKRKSP
jgi:hypothetical protein